MQEGNEEDDFIIQKPYDLNKEVFKSEFEDECYFQFSDLKGENRIVQKLQTYDPKKDKKYIVVCPGLNLKGRCDNKDCDSYISKSHVWIMKRYGVFDIGREITKINCPSCNQKIPSRTIKSLGYMSAKVTFEGSRIINDNDEDFKYTDQESKGMFVKFKDFDESMSKWSYLSVTVEKNK